MGKKKIQSLDLEQLLGIWNGILKETETEMEMEVQTMGIL
jgi:hypothetical protein